MRSSALFALGVLSVVATTSVAVAAPPPGPKTRAVTVVAPRPGMPAPPGARGALPHPFKPLQLHVVPRNVEAVPRNIEAVPAPTATPEFNPLKRRRMAMPAFPAQPGDLAF